MILRTWQHKVETTPLQDVLVEGKKSFNINLLKNCKDFNAADKTKIGTFIPNRGQYFLRSHWKPTIRALSAQSSHSLSQTIPANRRIR